MAAVASSSFMPLYKFVRAGAISLAKAGMVLVLYPAMMVMFVQ